MLKGLRALDGWTGIVVACPGTLCDMTKGPFLTLKATQQGGLGIKPTLKNQQQ